MRRHLVKKPSRTQGGRGSPGGLAPILRRKKKKKTFDRRPHEVPGLRLPLPSSPEPPLPSSLPHLSAVSPRPPVPPGGPQTLTLASASGVCGAQ